MNPDASTAWVKPIKRHNCTRKVVIKFRYTESDMYNSVPAVVEINGLWSNFSFVILTCEKREFGYFPSGL